jgi:hypothetical protein
VYDKLEKKKWMVLISYFGKGDPLNGQNNIMLHLCKDCYSLHLLVLWTIPRILPAVYSS